MTRSAMREALIERLNSLPGRRDAKKLADAVLVVLDPVSDWDLEEKEVDWPELEGVDSDFGAHLVPPGDPSRSDVERIALAWNFRRPGGQMEQRLLNLADSMRACGEHSWADVIEAALRLGITGTTL